MKVGILTFTYGDNFGQRLQNYALQCRLASMGCDVFTLRQTGRKKNKSYELKQFIKGCMGKSDYIMKMKRHRKFADFDRQYISYYPERIGEGCIPEGLNEEFDYFVCGSDQIWSPFSDDVNDTLFLTFAPREKRISYAASIAADSIPEENQDKYKNRLCGFERISLREDRLSDWIERNNGVKQEIHIDPVLVFDSGFWSSISRKPGGLRDKKYILSYFLGSNSRLKDMVSEYGLEDYEIIDLMNDKAWYYIRPDEFVYLVRNAEAVITDSYHGVLFSVLFHKAFAAADRQDELSDMSSRLAYILSLLGLEDRWCSRLQGDKLNGSIDYEAVDRILAEQREKSDRYLRECLKRIN